MDSETFYNKYIEKDFEEQYVPHAFEKVCKEYLIRQNKKGKMDPLFEQIGKYYYDNPKEHKNGEFDVVTYDSKGYVFYEVKFRKTAIDAKMIEEEIKQVNLTGLDCYKYVFLCFITCGYITYILHGFHKLLTRCTLAPLFHFIFCRDFLCK